MKGSPDQWRIYRDIDAVALYAVNGKTWISYDDVKTVTDKAKWVVSSGYGGVALFALSYDDFRGDCGTQNYPVLRAVNSGLGRTPGSIIQDPITPAPPTGDFVCYHVGYYRNPTSCQKFHQCTVNELGVYERIDLQCNLGHAFDQRISACNLKSLVSGCENSY